MKSPLPGLALAFLGAAGLRADVALAPLFADHAVLQQGKLVPVWGRADPGEHVSVSFAGQTVGTTAGEDGNWEVLLLALAPSATGADLVAVGKANTLTCHDVLVGEVWLCSGQSNMQFTVDWPANKAFHLLNADQEVAAARFPLIRQFEVDRQAAPAPSNAAKGTWVPCTPATVGRFSAVAYFFARDIHQRLGVPVGVIDSTWGGTPVEAWLSPPALASDPAFAIVPARWNQNPPPSNYPHKPSWQPASLFNGMINPMLPYALRGVLWYQGEANANRAAEYHRLFAAMITDWRTHSGQGELPFYWVQLAAYEEPSDRSGASWAYLREAQAQTLSLPETGMAVTIDIGDPKNIHPANKQEVGRRLALIAKDRVYGLTGDFSGPVFAAAEAAGPAMVVRFRYAETGLTAAARPLQSFELAGADRKFHPAEAAIDRDTVVVRSSEVPAPVAVRYAWRNAPDANLYNGAGLPAAPFRSDDW
jgi:sialate O-acetylesterase